MWCPEQVTHDLTYDFFDGSIRTVAGTILGTAPNLTAAAAAFPEGTVFLPLNVPKD